MRKSSPDQKERKALRNLRRFASLCSITTSIMGTWALMIEITWQKMSQLFCIVCTIRTLLGRGPFVCSQEGFLFAVVFGVQDYTENLGNC